MGKGSSPTKTVMYSHTCACDVNHTVPLPTCGVATSAMSSSGMGWGGGGVLGGVATLGYDSSSGGDIGSIGGGGSGRERGGVATGVETGEGEAGTSDTA